MGWEFLTETSTIEEALARVETDERTLSAWLSDMLETHGLDRSAVIRRSRLNQTFAYQIFAGVRRASRDKLIQLAFGFGLGPDDACELLERGGASPLRQASRRDVVIAFSLERRLDLGACDDLLWGLRERTLVQPDA